MKRMILFSLSFLSLALLVCVQVSAQQVGVSADVTYSESVRLKMGYDWGITRAYQDARVYRNQFFIGISFLFK